MGGEIGKIWYPYETCQPVLVIFKKIFHSERSPSSGQSLPAVFTGLTLFNAPHCAFPFWKISGHFITFNITKTNCYEYN
jgi:hypothetical protein